MPADDVMERAGEMFGFAEWSLGLGKIGTFFVWFGASLILVMLIGLVYYLWTIKKVYNQQIWVFGMIGNSPMLKWTDKAKVINLGKAGERLFLLRKRKRLIPPPTIQSGARLWLYWERSDNELINIGLQDLDEEFRRIKVKFIDTDMRMQRLGIEKNLQYRLQKQGFWEKYGERIVQFGFYAFITILIIVLFVQWRKAASAIAGALTVAKECECPACPTTQTGLTPAIAFILLNKYHIWKDGTN